MKTLKKHLIAMLILATITSACKKERVDLNKEPEKKSIPMSVFFEQNRSNSTETFVIDAGMYSSIVTSQGSGFYFPAFGFKDPNGNTVTGNITVKILEIRNKKDMVLKNVGTLANDYPNLIRPLISGGMYYIEAFQNNVNLTYEGPYYVTTPAPMGVDNQMQTFTALNTEPVIWNLADTTPIVIDSSQFNYYSVFNAFGWINLDYFMNIEEPRTFVQIQIPQGFNYTNCKVFISFDGLNSLCTVYNYNSGIYTTAPYYLPVGINVHFIALSVINSNPHVAIIPATIQQNHFEIISSLAQTTFGQFETDLLNLP